MVDFSVSLGKEPQKIFHAHCFLLLSIFFPTYELVLSHKLVALVNKKWNAYFAWESNLQTAVHNQESIILLFSTLLAKNFAAE